MNHRDIRNAIMHVLNAIENIGHVQAYQRHANTQSALSAFYVEGRELCGWFVERVGWKQRPVTFAANKLIQHWRITGLTAIDDSAASDLNFHDLLDRIIDAFNRDETLRGVVSSIREDDIAGIQLSSAEPVKFAGILCHRAVLRLTTVSYVALPEEEDGPEIDEVVLGLVPDVGRGFEKDYRPLAETPGRDFSDD